MALPRGGNRPLFSPVVDGRKTCSVCRMTKPISEFYKRKEPRGGYVAGCKACVAEAFRVRKEADPLIEFRKSLWVNYRMRVEDYDAILASQGGRCKICGTKQPGGRGWNVDHDHACCPTPAKSCGGCIRGILCGHCNRMLGYARDSTRTLLAAVDYLEER